MFHDAILVLIVVNGLSAGLEAIPTVVDQYEHLLFWVFAISQVVFVAEIGIRLLAYRPALRNFFRDGWNTFDFTIVVVSLLPAIGGLTLVARLFRLLRLLRVVSMSDALRHLAGRRSSLAFVAALFFLSVYILAIAGFHLFGAAIPDAWGDLGRALLSLSSLASPAHAGGVIAALVGYSPWSAVYVVVAYLIGAGSLVGAATSVVGRNEPSTA